MAKRLALIGALIVAVGTAAALAPAADSGYSWHLTPTGSDARLRGVSAVSAHAAWASGSLGTVLRTVDGGATWQQVGPPDTAALQFRDIEAFDANRAVILSIGEGTDSRIYVTTDGGRSWALTFVNDDPRAFYDCMTFFDAKHGLALSDPVDGKFRLIETTDGGRSWHLDTSSMPDALPGEFAFAASGQCLVGDDEGNAWFGTGGAAQARVFRSSDVGDDEHDGNAGRGDDDHGAGWQVSATPIRSGPSAGIFALAFRDEEHGLAVGGDFAQPTVAPDALALTSNGGKSWKLVSNAPNEYRSGAAWVNDRVAIAVGPTGSNVSVDRGKNWQPFDSGSFDTVDCTRAACWAAGEHGRVAYLVKSP